MAGLKRQIRYPNAPILSGDVTIGKLVVFRQVFSINFFESEEATKKALVLPRPFVVLLSSFCRLNERYRIRILFERFLITTKLFAAVITNDVVVRIIVGTKVTNSELVVTT